MALNSQDKNIVVLVGGVGGAKLALGLQQVVPPERLTVIVNTGDDFWHYGLRITPDIDTVLYTLAQRVDPVNGWGLQDDTTNVLQALQQYGEDTWFRLGDQDIATHLLRTHLLRSGHSLTQVIHHLSAQMGIQPAVLPMTDAEVATIVDTVEYGELAFQTYFVRYRWQPTVKGLRYAGIVQAAITDAVRQAITNADIIFFGPSNPWLSLAPILALPGMRDLLRSRDVPRVAVTPIVRGKALKGPAAKLMHELGYEVSAATVAAYYGDVLNGFVFDAQDADTSAGRVDGLKVVALDTIMRSDADKMRLARQLVDWIQNLKWETS